MWLETGLRRPYPVTVGLRGELVRILAISLVATLILVLLSTSGANIFFYLLLSAACLVTASLSRIGLIVLANEENWTVGKEVVFSMSYVVLIASVILAIVVFSTDIVVTLEVWINFIVITFLFAAMPLTLEVLLTERWLLKKALQEIRDIDPVKVTLVRPPNDDRLILGDPAGSDIDIAIEHFRYARARENYCEVVFLDASGTLSRILLRMPLKALSEAIAELNSEKVMKCHRSWLVNLDVVNNISGNAQGYKLGLRNIDIPVPVSRRYGPDILEYLKKK